MCLIIHAQGGKNYAGHMASVFMAKGEIMWFPGDSPGVSSTSRRERL